VSKLVGQVSTARKILNVFLALLMTALLLVFVVYFLSTVNSSPIDFDFIMFEVIIPILLILGVIVFSYFSFKSKK
jgi:hypothetical protein